MSQSCATCIHFARLSRPLRGRGLTLTGICAKDARTYSRASLMSESCGSMCSFYESAEERAREVIEEICAEEEA